MKMDYRLTVFFFLAVVVALAQPAAVHVRERRDVMDSMKNAWNEMVRTLSDAGEAVVHVFKPTEKSVIDKVVDSFVITEKSTLNKMADSVRGLTN